MIEIGVVVLILDFKLSIHIKNLKMSTKIIEMECITSKREEEIYLKNFPMKSMA